LLERFLAPEDWPPDLAAHWLCAKQMAERCSGRELDTHPRPDRSGSNL
jgi:hypothetical protein